jgi:hypothetical protein
MFKTSIDTSLIRASNIGEYQVTVSLDDDGPMPRFVTQSILTIKIGFEAAPEIVEEIKGELDGILNGEAELGIE